MGPYLDVERAPAGSAGCGPPVSAYVAHGNSSEPSKETLDSVIHFACDGLSITDEQLRAELEESGDITDVQSGALTSKALRLTAETLALMRYATLPAQAIETDKSRVQHKAA